MLMLLVLISGSAWWLNAATGTMLQTSSHGYNLQADQWAMINARQSLLSYASLYAYFYGPSGAGPGHLPCPDTDSRVPVAIRRPFAGDGPNPPCGSSSNSNGHLPRHVSLPGNRYAFHSEPHQRFEYSVYADVVNNPINRIVNPSLLATVQSRNAIAATIESDVISTTVDVDRRPEVRITHAALLQAVKPAVAAWFLDVVERSQLGSCQSLGENESSRKSVRTQETHDVSDAGQSYSSMLTQRCRRLSELRAMCHSTLDENGHAHGKANAVLLLLIDQLPEVDQCVTEHPGDSTMERVAINRHWFVRNRWHEWLQIDTSEDCLSGVIECSLVYVPENSIHATQSQPHKLVLQWQSVI